MTSRVDIRGEFIRYFETLKHTFVPSSPVVLQGDPTLLFANAGMNQFKDVFLGIGARPYNRAVNSQKCIRVSGKHNDLEDVGRDTYHHTFFEMLGNWSFGDYFKAEAIEWAWKLLTQVWGLPKERLYATVFAGDEGMGLAPDAEAASLWAKVTDIDPSHIKKFGQKDNFWQMAETGPCGPCSEIHIDLTPDGSGGSLVNKGDARVIELWNLVFIQFDRDESGKLTPLPARHVDTGMGLERTWAAMKLLNLWSEGKPATFSDYGTPLFVPIIRKIEEITGCTYGSTRTHLADRYDSDDTENIVDIVCRVLADHVRTLTFAISDGVLPSNEGRGYVMRRLLRRAARYGRKLEVQEPFIHKLVPTVVEMMKGAFPELADKAQLVTETIHEEEKAFGRTLDRGIDIFEQVASRVQSSGGATFPGDEAFKLYDTYGFPLDLTQLMARERGLTVNEEQFAELMNQQRQRARQASKGAGVKAALAEDLSLPATDDSAKYSLSPLEARLFGWIADGKWSDSGELRQGQEAALVVDRTNFYAESGGQIGDKGRIIVDGAEFVVEDTLKAGDGTVLHQGRLVVGQLKPGQAVRLEVNRRRRLDTMNNHTATHLLQWSLRQVLGDHVKQAGSLVNDEYLRFDFTHGKALSDKEIDRVEQLVLQRIDESAAVVAKDSTLAEALASGVTALFGEKYGEQVRVIAVGAADLESLQGAFSRELCGGTHVDNTAQIMDFKIIREESLQTGVRRITARTGRALRGLLHERYRDVGQLSQLLKAAPEQIGERVAALMEENRKLKKQLKDGPVGVDVNAAVDQLVDGAVKIGPATLVVGELPSAPVDKIRAQVDRLKKKLDNPVIFFGTRSDGKVLLLAAVSDELIKQGLSAGEIVRRTAPIVGGGGGGKEHLAQAGGKLPDKLPEALAEVEKIIRETLSVAQ